MSIFGIFGKKRPEPKKVEVSQKRNIDVASVLSALSADPRSDKSKSERVLDWYRNAEEVKGYRPPDEVKAIMGMDSDINYSYIDGFKGHNLFFGYPYLSTLAQKIEYRQMVTTIADEMTREWVVLKYKGESNATTDDEKRAKINQINDELERLNVREVIKKMIEHDGYYGMGAIYISVKTASGQDPDDTELTKELSLSGIKAEKGFLKGFVNIEPIWLAPSEFNATNPLAKDFYKPSKWIVMGRVVHGSRLLRLVSQEVPDMYKPAYNFGGISRTQLAEEYVNNYLSTRDSVKDSVKSFSVSGLATDLQSLLSQNDFSDAEDFSNMGLVDRSKLFVGFKDNRSMMLINKDTEEFFQHNMPLSGLPELQSQSQEQMAAAANIPVVKLLGITPSGLNASAEGEITVFYDYVAACQNSQIRPILKRMIDFVQYSLFGMVDESITFDFVPLKQLSELEAAQVQKVKAETDDILITAETITFDESRDRVINDKDSGYNTLKPYDEDEETQRDDLEGIETVKEE